MHDRRSNGQTGPATPGWKKFTVGAVLSAAAATGILLPTLGRAREPQPPPSTPLLEQLNQETQALYERARPGIVRVYLPPPQWAMDLMGRDFALRKWDLQAGHARGDLREQITRAASDKMFDMTIAPSTQPTTAPAAGASEPRGYRLVQRVDGAYDLVGGPGGDDRAVIDVSPRSAGFVLDSQGHVLVPYLIEPETVGNEPLTVACGDGNICAAEFVGNDPATMLTVLRLKRPTGSPMALDGRRPKDGSLVLLLTSTGDSARLQMWTGTQQETGVVLGMDGTLHGFLRQGQFLEAARVAPVVKKILETGHAARTRVGVWVREVLPADALRREIPQLRDRPALYVADVVRNTPADRAGLRKGDLILAVGPETTGDPPSFAAAIVPFQGRTVPFRIFRDGREIELTIDLSNK